MIIGRDFLDNQNIIVVYEPRKERAVSNNILLAQEFPFAEICEESKSKQGWLDNMEINFGVSVRERLRSVINEVETEPIPIVDDDYYVSIKLKGASTYVYTPRRFVLAERRQLQQITDDLLARGVIIKSTSPYCARIVPVRKKNGGLRLCVDLRPLNKRIEKQK